MKNDYESIKSDHDIVTVLLKGPKVVPFQIEVLRSRKIGSISRYLCEYRGLGFNSFLLSNDKNKEITDNETIASICDSKQLKIFISIKNNIGGYNKIAESIPEVGDNDSLNSSNAISKNETNNIISETKNNTVFQVKYKQQKPVLEKQNKSFNVAKIYENSEKDQDDDILKKNNTNKN